MAPLRTRLQPDPAPELDLLALEGSVPAPVLRAKAGEDLFVRIVNDGPLPLTLHWHGLRGPNAVDGVGGLTQPPIAPGASLEQRFTPPDPGIILLRPFAPGHSGALGGRGVAGALVVEEPEPPKVDADHVILVGDMRLAPDGNLAPFGAALEAATGGRLGGLLVVNGKPAPAAFSTRPGSRLRLRLANIANARAMRIRFDDLKTFVIAIDGQPTDPFEPLRSTLPFPPGSRYDVIVEVPATSGPKGSVMGLVGQGGTALVTVEGAGESLPRGDQAAIAPLRPNDKLPAEIRLQNAARKELTIEGGATRDPSGAVVYTGDPARIWTINGAPGSGTAKPALSVKRGTFVVLAIHNRTPTAQPMHLHGHSFRLLHARDDGWEPYWLDTLSVPEMRSVHIAFRADNPGRWALSSTVLERFDTGLWTWFEVT
ncbi:MAG TPA: multicopper oxidase family protein [Beijerinckiaceae bacterium]